MFVWTFLLRITHTIISQSSADSSWITLYISIPVELHPVHVHNFTFTLTILLRKQNVKNQKYIFYRCWNPEFVTRFKKKKRQFQQAKKETVQWYWVQWDWSLQEREQWDDPEPESLTGYWETTRLEKRRCKKSTTKVCDMRKELGQVSYTAPYQMEIMPCDKSTIYFLCSDLIWMLRVSPHRSIPSHIFRSALGG